MSSAKLEKANYNNGGRTDEHHSKGEHFNSNIKTSPTVH